jgi:hypothetical protein
LSRRIPEFRDKEKSHYDESIPDFSPGRDDLYEKSGKA